MNMKPFSQAVQWPATIVRPEQAAEFVEFIAETFNGTRAQYLFNSPTRPDNWTPFNEGDLGTGGRDDAYFAVHEEDIGKFALARFQYGMRWVDDVLANEASRNEPTIFEDCVHELKSWSTK